MQLEDGGSYGCLHGKARFLALGECVNVEGIRDLRRVLSILAQTAEKAVFFRAMVRRSEREVMKWISSLSIRSRVSKNFDLVARSSIERTNGPMLRQSFSVPLHIKLNSAQSMQYSMSVQLRSSPVVYAHSPMLKIERIFCPVLPSLTTRSSAAATLL